MERWAADSPLLSTSCSTTATCPVHSSSSLSSASTPTCSPTTNTACVTTTTSSSSSSSSNTSDSSKTPSTPSTNPKPAAPGPVVVAAFPTPPQSTPSLDHLSSYSTSTSTSSSAYASQQLHPWTEETLAPADKDKALSLDSVFGLLQSHQQQQQHDLDSDASFSSSLDPNQHDGPLLRDARFSAAGQPQLFINSLFRRHNPSVAVSRRAQTFSHPASANASSSSPGASHYHQQQHQHQSQHHQQQQRQQQQQYQFGRRHHHQHRTSLSLLSSAFNHLAVVGQPKAASLLYASPPSTSQQELGFESSPAFAPANKEQLESADTKPNTGTLTSSVGSTFPSSTASSAVASPSSSSSSSSVRSSHPVSHASTTPTSEPAVNSDISIKNSGLPIDSFPTRLTPARPTAPAPASATTMSHVSPALHAVPIPSTEQPTRLSEQGAAAAHSNHHAIAHAGQQQELTQPRTHAQYAAAQAAAVATSTTDAATATTAATAPASHQQQQQVGVSVARASAAVKTPAPNGGAHHSGHHSHARARVSYCSSEDDGNSTGPGSGAASPAPTVGSPLTPSLLPQLKSLTVDELLNQLHATRIMSPMGSINTSLPSRFAAAGNKPRASSLSSGSSSPSQSGMSSPRRPSVSTVLEEDIMSPRTIFEDDYVFDKTLGEGSYGKVKLAVHKLTQEKVAIKIIDKASLTENSDRERIIREIIVLKNLRHPNIARLYEVIDKGPDIHLVIQYCSGGELFDYIVAHQRVKEREAVKLFRQIVSALEYCHKRNVIHRDLKTENLLLDGHKNIKIIDFGFTNTFNFNSLLETYCGSPAYAAPEMISAQKYTGPEADVWSLGVTLFAIICGYLPFDDDDSMRMYALIREGVYYVPDYVSPEARDLIANLLKVRPQDRLTIPQIKKHHWTLGAKLSQDRSFFPDPFHEEVRDESDADTELDDIIVAAMGQLDFTREEIEVAVRSSHLNRVAATYHLLKDSQGYKEIQVARRNRQRKFSNVAISTQVHASSHSTSASAEERASHAHGVGTTTAAAAPTTTSSSSQQPAAAVSPHPPTPAAAAVTAAAAPAAASAASPPRNYVVAAAPPVAAMDVLSPAATPVVSQPQVPQVQALVAGAGIPPSKRNSLTSSTFPEPSNAGTPTPSASAAAAAAPAAHKTRPAMSPPGSPASQPKRPSRTRAYTLGDTAREEALAAANEDASSALSLAQSHGLVARSDVGMASLPSSGNNSASTSPPGSLTTLADSDSALPAIAGRQPRRRSSTLSPILLRIKDRFVRIGVPGVSVGSTSSSGTATPTNGSGTPMSPPTSTSNSSLLPLLFARHNANQALERTTSLGNPPPVASSSSASAMALAGTGSASNILSTGTVTSPVSKTDRKRLFSFDAAGAVIKNALRRNPKSSTGLRIMRGAFNAATTTSKDPILIMEEILRVLDENTVEYERVNKWGVVVRIPTSHALHNGKEGGEIRFVMEICRIKNIELNGIHLLRLQGDIWAYKRILDKLLPQIRL